MHKIEESLLNKTHFGVLIVINIVFLFHFEQIWMNAVATSITAIRSPAAQIIVVHLLALVIKATLETALSASSITQVWSDIKLQHSVLMVNSKLIYIINSVIQETHHVQIGIG